MKYKIFLAWCCVSLMLASHANAEQAKQKKQQAKQQTTQKKSTSKQQEQDKPQATTGAKAPAAETSGSDDGFDMESLMNQTTEAGQSADVIYKGKSGAWVLVRGKSDNTCSVIYFDKQTGSSLSYRGPRPDVGDKGSLVFIGPEIPPANAPVEVKVLLETDGEPAQTIPAGHLPKQGEIPAAILVSTDIKVTAAAMQTTEKVKLSLNGKAIYQLEWDGGGYQAKDALLNCLSGKGN